jgi:hypothetical protein
MKLSPYTMFYRKFYQLVFSRLDLLCLRLLGNQSNAFEKATWNFFLHLFESSTEKLFRARDLDQILLSVIYFLANSAVYQRMFAEPLTWTRLIQAYKSMPNARLKILRSVFLHAHDDSRRQQAAPTGKSTERHVATDDMSRCRCCQTPILVSPRRSRPARSI